MNGRFLFHSDDAAAVLPGALRALQELRARGLTHRYVRHVRSSQAFALSLFAPLDDLGVQRLFALLGHPDVHAVEAPVFEYEDPADRLGEASSRSRHRTQVDVLLRGTTLAGRRVLALIEVKLGEPNFGSCSAFESAENPDRDVCGQPGLFGGEPDRCFQIRNHGRGHRRYAEYLKNVTVSAPTPRADDGGCWVRTGSSQPMRNLALAHLLVSEGEADNVVFALCAPRGHTAMWRRFDEFRALFSDTDTVLIRDAPAEAVADAHLDGGKAMRERYAAAWSDTALLHFSADGGTLLGVWLYRGGTTTSFYDDGPDAEAADSYADAVIAGEDWSSLIERLPRQAPYMAWWEKVDCPPAESIKNVFARVAADTA